MALSTTARQALWYINALSQLGHPLPVHLHADNTSSINVAETLVNNPRTKHIDVAYHFSREQLLRKSFSLSYVPSGQNIGDVMTKELLSVDHFHHLNTLGLIE